MRAYRPPADVAERYVPETLHLRLDALDILGLQDVQRMMRSVGYSEADADAAAAIGYAVWYTAHVQRCMDSGE